MRRGQTLTEFALVVPVLFMLIMGVLDGGLLMFSVGTARYAASEGSRVAAQVGNVATADSQIVGIVRSTVGTTQLFQVTEVDVYRLNQDGVGNLTPDPGHYNRYQLDGTAMGPISWPSATRNVSNGSSDFLGLTIHYTYRWKAGFFAPLGPVTTVAESYVRLEPQSY
jgi:Flp pilus assembly protein TadG